jgi:hypothetical protein
MLSQNDRIAFSLNIVSAPAAIAQLAITKAQIAKQAAKLENLDIGNANLITPTNLMIEAYQPEFNYLDGNTRTTFNEQNVIDAANKVIGNYFFPNNTTVTVPSLAAMNNVWPRPNPYALTFAIGKNANETYSPFTGEPQSITAISALIALTSTHQDIENTSGQYATQGNAMAMPPVSDSVQPYPAVQTLKSNLVAAVSAYRAVLTSELASIVTSDTNPTNASNNTAAAAAVTTTIAALDTWLGNPDFHPVPGSITTYAAFYAYDSSTLAPTKLHSTQLSALQTALTARQAAINIRIAQLTTLLGTISQNLTTGVVIGTGLYFKRYSFLALRLNALSGSLTQLLALSGTMNAQDAIAANIASTAATYATVVPSTRFATPANGTSTIAVLDASAFLVGEKVYVFAEDQVELLRAIKSINGNSVILNDSVPAKYSPASNARIYKDLT